MFKKLLAILAAGVLAAGVLVGCGGGNQGAAASGGSGAIFVRSMKLRKAASWSLACLATRTPSAM